MRLFFGLYKTAVFGILDKLERKFVIQGAYNTRNITQSQDLAWTLLRIFPRELLNLTELHNIIPIKVQTSLGISLGKHQQRQCM